MDCACFDWSSIDSATVLDDSTDTTITVECRKKEATLFRLSVQRFEHTERVMCRVCYHLSAHPSDRVTVTMQPRVKDMRREGWSLEQFCGDLLREKRYPFRAWRATLIQKGRDAL